MLEVGWIMVMQAKQEKSGRRSSGTFALDGAWCFFADPRALYFKGKYERTYAGWITSKGDVKLGYYDHQSGLVEEMIVREKLQRDDHANPSLYIDEGGRITVFYSAHNGSAMYYRTTERAEDIYSLGQEQTVPVNAPGNKGYTYPTPVYLSDEKRFYLFWRGGNFKPNFSVCANLERNMWLPARTLIEDQGHRPYIRYVSNNKDAIHFAFTDGHPHVEPTNSIYYACCRRGELTDATGAAIKPLDALPLKAAEAETVFDGKKASRASWIWDIALDESGFPVIVYAVFESKTDHRYYYSRFDGQKWLTNEMTAAGPWFPQTSAGKEETEPCYSAGIILDHRNPDHVYLSRHAEGGFSLEHWRTEDGGRSWQSDVLAASESEVLARPFMSRGAGSERNWPALLFWMKGKYVQYTNYCTSLEFMLSSSTD